MILELVFLGCCFVPLIIGFIVVAALNIWEVTMYDHY